MTKAEELQEVLMSRRFEGQLSLSRKMITAIVEEEKKPPAKKGWFRSLCAYLFMLETKDKPRWQARV